MRMMAMSSREVNDLKASSMSAMLVSTSNFNEPTAEILNHISQKPLYSLIIQ